MTPALLAIALVALVFTIRSVGLQTLGRYLKLIGWWWIAVAALEILNTTLHSTALRAFAAPDKLKLRDAFLAQLAGRAVNAVTPTGNLGEVVKMSVLTDVVTPSRAVSTVLLYNVVSFTIELGIVAIAAPFFALLVPMPLGFRILFLGAGVLCLAASIGLYALVRRGMLASLAKVPVKLRLISQARYAGWYEKLHAIDEKLRMTAGASRRERVIGIVALTLSRMSALVLSLLILRAVGASISFGFFAAWTVGSFPIYLASTLVPMGVGVSEGGYYGLFRTLGYNPALAVTLVIARRCITLMYATIGLLLVTFSETVKRARARHRETPVTAPAAVSSIPMAIVVVKERGEVSPS
ncbi:hypothetical protein BH11MYX3_BH11MYX3_12920 [soil metagenome]